MANPLVGVVMGSASDLETMQVCVDQLGSFGVPCEVRVLSAHRTPAELSAWVASAQERGVEVFVAAAGMAAALPGVVAAQTSRPVLGVPIESKLLGGLDSLLSMVQMPGGIPVGTLAVGKAGAVNAAILATQILALAHPEYGDVLAEHRAAQAAMVLGTAATSEG
ncbi:MAG TPA: 5-(carboxyamino)imidazole ribonucleotide mutase [Actinomycetota bacterium]|nr:5-(carboxyamino)imidazole ribonucleotide mutase [Actinomycetota bacterium]